MEIVKALEAQESPNPHGVSSRVLLNTENVQLVMVTLQPGEVLKLHITPVDAFFYVLEGRGIVEIDGERQEIYADTLVNSPAKRPHRLMNESDEVFRFLVGKTPRPVTSTRIL